MLLTSILMSNEEFCVVCLNGCEILLLVIVKVMIPTLFNYL